MPALIMYSSIIYGPVRSRRLGVSLGINLLPVGRKVCSFNCVYCECGDTTELIDQARDEHGQRTTFPSVEAVSEAMRNALQVYPNLDALTFAGHGEPTLHPQFPEVVQAVRDIRDHYQPQAKIGVLSSASLIMRPRPRAGIDLCELRMMKLDAGDEATFQAIDRPAATIRLQPIIDELARMPNIILQICLIDGPVQNVRGAPWAALVRAVGIIQPQYVQLYAIERQTPEPWVERVSYETLRQCAVMMQERTGVPVEIYE
ncbi:MAG: hypothetical protein HC837_11130 [Chloroflexaceae bacterium]|nr:hypothetical protein [Chloroflexaceae bacterium]